jgi:hypothetical protein
LLLGMRICGGGKAGGCGRSGGVPGAGVRGVPVAIGGCCRSGGVPGAGMRNAPKLLCRCWALMGGVPSVGVRGVAVELDGPEVKVAGLARAATS